MIDPRSAQPGSYRTSGHDAETGRQTQVAALSGRASVRPGRPDAASPAGWSPPPAGEAAPPVRHRGPARSDSASGVPEARWLSLTRLGPRHIPVVGPTEALPGRPGGPGMTGPRDAAPRPLGHPRKSGWQLAHQVWQDAGVDWETAAAANQPDRYDPSRYEPDPYQPSLSALYEQNLPEPTAYGPDPYEPGPYEPDLDEADRDAPRPGQSELGGALTGTQPDYILRDDAVVADTHATSSDLPVLRESTDSRFGIGPWPVQEPAAVTAPQPVLADERADLDEADGDEADGDKANRHEVAAHDEPADDDRPGVAYPPEEQVTWSGLPRRIRPADRGQSESWPPAPRPPVPAPRPPAPTLRSPVSSRPAPALRFAGTAQPLPAAAPPSAAPSSGVPTPPHDFAPPRPLTQPRDSAPPRDIPPSRDFAPPRALTPPRDTAPPRDIPPPREVTPSRDFASPRGFAPRSTPAPPSAFAAPGAFGAPPAYASPRPRTPLGAPVDAPPLDAPSRDTAPPLNTARSAPQNAPRYTPLNAPQHAPLGGRLAPAAPIGEPDELFRAWQGSVRQATERRGTWPATRPAGAAARRRRSWQAARIGVPAAVIVTVGAGALMMLTGRANEMLAQRASSGPLTSAAPGASASLGIAGLGAGATLTGYPGEHGAAVVAALGSAGGTLMAVGYANGHPAVWRHAAGGAWSLVSATLFGGLTGHLTSVTHGPAGWIAVGSAIEGGSAAPVAFWSSDGVSWSPLLALTAHAGAGAQFLGVASGPGGYVVVGRQGTGAAAYASFWRSANLTEWAGGASNATSGTVAAAAVAVGNGFVAVGAAANCHAIWTSADGRQWTEHDLPKPSGATSATLQSVAAAAGGRFVAAGFATAGAVNVPLVVTSAGAGAPLTQVVLGANGAAATVTGVTATSGGFVAVGLAGPAGERHAVEWTSRDGLAWSAATPLASAGSSEITALTTSGAVAAGTAQRSAGPTVLTIPSR